MDGCVLEHRSHIRISCKQPGEPSSVRDQLFKTKITELLGIAHPILCGGLGPGVSDARYVAAVVNAGGMGFIMALGWTDPDEFRVELRRCRELTAGKPFGVNLYISRQAGGAERAR